MLSFELLTEKGATVTFLLRKRSCFDADESIRPYIASGKARLVQGDALKEEDKLDPSAYSRFKLIFRASGRLLRLVNTLLLFSSADAKRLQAIYRFIASARHTICSLNIHLEPRLYRQL